MWWDCWGSRDSCFCRHWVCAAQRLEAEVVRTPPVPADPVGVIACWLDVGIIVVMAGDLLLGARLRETTSSTRDCERDIAITSHTSWKLLPWSDTPFHCSTSSPAEVTRGQRCLCINRLFYHQFTILSPDFFQQSTLPIKADSLGAIECLSFTIYTRHVSFHFLSSHYSNNMNHSKYSIQLLRFVYRSAKFLLATNKKILFFSMKIIKRLTFSLFSSLYDLNDNKCFNWWS